MSDCSLILVIGTPRTLYNTPLLPIHLLSLRWNMDVLAPKIHPGQLLDISMPLRGAHVSKSGRHFISAVSLANS